MRRALNWTRTLGGEEGFPVILWGIVAVAVLLRLASAILQGETVASLPGINDQISYHTLALRILTGHGFTFPTPWWPATAANQPTAQWSFLYPLYLAAIYGVFGVHPLVARLIQAVIAGVLQPILTYRIGRRLFGERVGVIAAGLVAVYAYFFYYAGALMTETFYILAVLLAFDLTLTLGQSEGSNQGYRSWLWLGLAIGMAALLRQLILLFLPLVYGWLFLVKWWKMPASSRVGSAGKTLRRLLPGLVIATCAIIALIVPWTIRNYVAFHQFVLLNTNDGYVFFWANNPIYGTSFIPILSDATYARMIPASLRGLNEAALNDALLKLGIEYVIANPGRFALLSLSRVKFFFEFWPSADSSLASNVSRVLSFGILLPFMVAGLFLTFRDWWRVRSEQRWALALIVLFMVGYSLLHILTWTLIRYRLPVDALLIVFAARAVSELVARLVDGRTVTREPASLPLSASLSTNRGRAGRNALAGDSDWKTLNPVER